MRFDSVVDLLKMEDEINENGFAEKVVTSRKTVFAKRASIKSAEFYSAAQSGYSLELMFDVYTLEFDSQNFVEYQSKIYKIIRTYEKGKFTELICQAHDDKPKGET
jgi:SPP1 family predicted phage head-tail adaptor